MENTKHFLRISFCRMSLSAFFFFFWIFIVFSIHFPFQLRIKVTVTSAPWLFALAVEDTYNTLLFLTTSFCFGTRTHLSLEPWVNVPDKEISNNSNTDLRGQSLFHTYFPHIWSHSNYQEGFDANLSKYLYA